MPVNGHQEVEKLSADIHLSAIPRVLHLLLSKRNDQLESALFCGVTAPPPTFTLVYSIW